jgi:hypothetical protein
MHAIARALRRAHAGRIAIDVLAALVFVQVAIRASVIVDLYWDTLAYHWPFAARAAGLCDTDCLALDGATARFYDAFPTLYHHAFGLLWRAFGTPAAGHWLSIAALASLCLYLWKRFDIPLAWSWLGFVAIPIVQIHLSASYADLTGNALLTIVIFVVLRVLMSREPPAAWEWGVALMALAISAGTKLQFIPLAVLAWLVLCVVSAWAWRLRNGSLPWRYVLALVPLGLIATLPQAAHNLITYGNPLYPMAFRFAGIHFPGMLTVKGVQEGMSVAEPWLKYPAPLRWLASVLEFGALSGRPEVWSVDQADVPRTSLAFRMGGYCVVYVLGLLALAASRMGDRRMAPLAWLFVALTLLCMVLPNSHELRYYQFWMLALVAGVLALVHSPLFAVSASAPGLRAPDSQGAPPMRLIAHAFILIVLTSVILVTGAHYLMTKSPRAPRVAQYTDAVVDALPPGATLCIANRDRSAIFYTRLFHPRSSAKVRVLREGESRAGCDRVVTPP